MKSKTVKRFKFQVQQNHKKDLQGVGLLVLLVLFGFTIISRYVSFCRPPQLLELTVELSKMSTIAVPTRLLKPE